MVQEDAGHELVKYIGGLYGYALALGRNPIEAEDLVQETYVRAMGSMNSLQADSNVKSWLFTILRNIWLNQLRQRGRTPKLVELDVDESTADIAIERSKDPLASYISKIESDRVREAIQQLPLDFREIILLREYEELSYREIASLLSCATGTVMSRLARARAELRTLLSSVGRPPNGAERKCFTI